MNIYMCTCMYLLRIVCIHTCYIMTQMCVHTLIASPWMGKRHLSKLMSISQEPKFKYFNNIRTIQRILFMLGRSEDDIYWNQRHIMLRGCWPIFSWEIDAYVVPLFHFILFSSFGISSLPKFWFYLIPIIVAYTCTGLFLSGCLPLLWKTTSLAQMNEVNMKLQKDSQQQSSDPFW